MARAVPKSSIKTSAFTLPFASVMFIGSPNEASADRGNSTLTTLPPSTEVKALEYETGIKSVAISRGPSSLGPTTGFGG
jgi:hypothetical protein